MTEATARRIANGVLGAAALGAAYVVVRTPRLRRLAWQLAIVATTSTVPAWFNQEVRRAWSEAGRRAG